MFKFSWKFFFFWLFIVFLATSFYSVIFESDRNIKKIPFSEFMKGVDNNSIREITIRQDSIEGKDSLNNSVHSTIYPIALVKVFDDFLKKNIKIDFYSSDNSMNSFLTVLLSWFPTLLLIGVWLYSIRGMQGGGGKFMGFGKSKAKLSEEITVTFNDVAGIDEVKSEVEDIISFLKEPKKFHDIGGKMPKGCLFVGPPGTGKTLLAKAIAGEASVPFFSISGSDFVEMFVGVGASRVRSMFEQAKLKAPCILFIDEIDAVGRHRGSGYGGGNDEREQTLNQLLVEMDGFDQSNKHVMVIAATNRGDVIDHALLRRFDKKVYFQNPDITGREQILKVHMGKVKINEDVLIKTIARGTIGFSGADLANLVNESALIAAKKGLTKIDMNTIEEAKDKILMGSERKSMVISDEQKRIVAFHEAGHAIATLFSHEIGYKSDPLHKVTIIPRGMALGVTVRLPEDDRKLESKNKILADIIVGLGGRAAEIIEFGEDYITTGASGDIKMITYVIRKMIVSWGMSDLVGYVNLEEENSHYISQDLAKNIDQEIKKIGDECMDKVMKLLKKRKKELKKLANGLLEKETLSIEEVKDLLGIDPKNV